ncbi:hypothetical protein HPB50_009036 [Hyalomma asiaticum]|uniref:Uncharacterized protein n=1 Tax=Hyalomma asiaticum TaxID=266040 RepID=A0ACB7T1V8_HYAAI|nr:hypothetical protein HPB50_009036 [Hyalomma asiaticum]
MMPSTGAKTLNWSKNKATGIPIKLAKEVGIDSEGREVMKCGFKIGGGIDQDFTRSPQGYTDNVCTPQHLVSTGLSICACFPLQGIYVTEVYDSSPAAKCGLKVHDKILQVNGYDFTMVTHKKAVEYIKKHPVLNMLIARKGVTHS